MFHVGDKVVYPTQGVGTIQYIENKEFCGEKQQYYKIHLINNNMDLLIPSKRIGHCNLREISDISTLNSVLDEFNDTNLFLDKFINITSKQRIQENNEKLKSGSLKDYCEVVVSLSKIKDIKSLNLNESQMLINAKKFLIDEVSLIKDISLEEANTFVNSNLHIH